MSLENRYSGTKKILGGTAYGTSMGAWRIYNAAKNGMISTQVIILKEAQRIDQMAGTAYGNGRLWWVIAAASGVGWNLQCPPGTRLVIPTSLQQIDALVG